MARVSIGWGRSSSALTKLTRWRKALLQNGIGLQKRGNVGVKVSFPGLAELAYSVRMRPLLDPATLVRHSRAA